MRGDGEEGGGEGSKQAVERQGAANSCLVGAATPGPGRNMHMSDMCIDQNDFVNTINNSELINFN